MRALIVVALLLLAGCATDTADEAPEQAVEEPLRVPHVVVAIIDTGINPYNPQFRDTSDLAYVHPSTYLDGFPADAPALRLSLNATDYEAAVLADCDAWLSVEPGQVYWIPGTRIVGAMTTNSNQQSCEEGDLPGAILDRGGHGTMTASRAAGADTGLCPECRIVVVQGFSTQNMLWTAQQPWIDLQSNSWGTLPVDYVLPAQDRMQARDAAATHPVFVSAGNGIGGFFGVTGHPIWYDGNTGPLGIIAVGAHDNGDWAVWGATMPHVVADGLGGPSAEPFGLEVDPTGAGGTSGAAPFAAGAMAQFLLEARKAANDTGSGVRDGLIVDGDLALSLEDAKRIYFHTADPAVPEDPFFDGAKCPDSGSTTCALYPAVPVTWDATGDAPKYYFVGYGGVGQATWQHALDVFLGDAMEPERPVEDAFFEADNAVRDAFDQNQP